MAVSNFLSHHSIPPVSLTAFLKEPNVCSANTSSSCSNFQRLSRLPVTGELDSTTLRQMSEPRCGVSDEGSQQIWAQRVDAIFTGKRRPQRRRRHSAAGGIVCV